MQPSPQAYVRPNVRAFGDIPLDTLQFLDTKSGLTPLQLGVYMNLRTSLWLRGSLPVGLRALAAIGQVTARTFEKMMPVLEILFDRDPEGRWRDHDLEQRRGALPTTLTIEQPSRRVVDPVKSASGKAGSDARWGKKRQALELVGGSDRATGDGKTPSGATAKMAEPMASDMAEMPSVDGTVPSSAMAGGPSSHSLLASSLPVDLTKEKELASKLLELNSEDVATIGRMAGPSRFAIVGDGTPPSRPVPRADGSDIAGPALSPEAARSAPSDAAIIDAVCKACRGKASRADVHLRLPAFRTWIDEGLDFDEDILPKIAAFARKKDRVDNCANAHIRADAQAHRASRLAAERIRSAAEAPPGSATIKVYRDDPALAGQLDGILAILGVSRQLFFSSDAGGAYRYFKTSDWQDAMVRVGGMGGAP